MFYYLFVLCSCETYWPTKTKSWGTPRYPASWPTSTKSWKEIPEPTQSQSPNNPSNHKYLYISLAFGCFMIFVIVFLVIKLVGNSRDVFSIPNQEKSLSNTLI